MRPRVRCRLGGSSSIPSDGRCVQCVASEVQQRLSDVRCSGVERPIVISNRRSPGLSSSDVRVWVLHTSEVTQWMSDVRYSPFVRPTSSSALFTFFDLLFALSPQTCLVPFLKRVSTKSISNIRLFCNHQKIWIEINNNPARRTRTACDCRRTYSYSITWC